MSNFFTVQEFAQKIGLHRNTIYKGIKQGKIVALRLTQGKNATYRIPKTEFDRIAIRDLEDIYQDLKTSHTQE